jgi:hypothetical protein
LPSEKAIQRKTHAAEEAAWVNDKPPRGILKVASSKLTTDGAKGGYPLPMCFGSIYSVEFLAHGHPLFQHFHLLDAVAAAIATAIR